MYGELVRLIRWSGDNLTAVFKSSSSLSGALFIALCIIMCTLMFVFFNSRLVSGNSDETSSMLYMCMHVKGYV